AAGKPGRVPPTGGDRGRPRTSLECGAWIHQLAHDRAHAYGLARDQAAARRGLGDLDLHSAQRRLHLGERTGIAVAFAENRFCAWPGDAERRIVPPARQVFARILITIEAVDEQSRL